MTTSTSYSKSQDMPVCPFHSSGLFEETAKCVVAVLSFWTDPAVHQSLLPFSRDFSCPSVYCIDHLLSFSLGDVRRVVPPRLLPASSTSYQTRVSVQRFSAAPAGSSASIAWTWVRPMPEFPFVPHLPPIRQELYS